MPVTRAPFGVTGDGQAVEVWTLTRGALEAEILTFGAAVRALRVPDRDGKALDVVLGYDEGYCVYTMGRASPAVSMDAQGRVVWSVRQEMWQSVVDGKQLDASSVLKGQEVAVATKSLGRCDVTPSVVSHSSTGRFLAVVGEGEYVVYTSRQLRSKAYGEGINFVWRPGSNDYCVQIVRLAARDER